MNLFKVNNNLQRKLGFGFILTSSKVRRLYLHCRTKCSFDVFGGWVVLEKNCATFYCGKILKQQVLLVPTIKRN